MSELMLVNPRRKRRRTPRRNRLGEFVRKNPRRSHTKRRRHHRVEHARANPRRHHRHVTRLRSNPRRHHRRRTHLRRNPRRMGMGSLRSFMNSTLVPAGVGALGALGVDVMIGYAAPHLPASLQSGMMLDLVKIAGAVGVGYVAGMVAGRKFGEEAMAGAITVTIYDIVKGYVKGAMPSLPLSGNNFGWVSPAPQIGMYVGDDNSYNGMGMYVSGNEAEYAY